MLNQEQTIRESLWLRALKELVETIAHPVNIQYLRASPDAPFEYAIFINGKAEAYDTDLAQALVTANETYEPPITNPDYDSAN